MYFSSRSTILFIAFIVVATNIIYLADLFGNNGQEIIQTVKVKVTTAKESTSNAWDSVKHWELWDPLEWAEDEDPGESGDVAQDENGTAHDLSEDLAEQKSVKGENANTLGADHNHAKEEGAAQPMESQSAQSPNNELGQEIASEPDDAVESISEVVVLNEAVNGEDVDEISSSTVEPSPQPTPVAQETSSTFGEVSLNASDANGHILSDEDENQKSGQKMSDLTPAASTSSGVGNVDDKDKANNDVDITPEKRKLTLTQLCDETKWTPGLYLSCHSHCGADHKAICGGLNNARNRLQTCMRLAIDAGATLILPQATIRAANATGEDLRRVNTASRPPDFFWDITYLKQSLAGGDRDEMNGSKAGACKQLKIRDWDDWPNVVEKRKLSVPYRRWSSASFTKGMFRAEIDATLWKSKLNREDINIQQPVVLEWSDPFLGWNYKESNEMGPVRAGLFKILKFNKGMLALADHVLRSPDLANGFIGIHLRGEKDWPAAFGSLDLQMKNYARAVSNINKGKTGNERVTTLYVSSGSQEPIGIFRDYVFQNLGPAFHVVDKWTLLADRPELLEQVESLGFDRKAIVEYKTLLEGKYFLGIITSTMSNLIAYARTVDRYVDTNHDFFYKVVFKGSRKMKNVYRIWSGNRAKMSGDKTTKLLVMNARDIMQRFP